MIFISYFFFSETVKDPKLLLKKIKKQKDEISGLIEQGETEKADEIKKDLAWQKAFEKTDGKKVSDRSSYSLCHIMSVTIAIVFLSRRSKTTPPCCCVR